MSRFRMDILSHACTLFHYLTMVDDGTEGGGKPQDELDADTVSATGSVEESPN